ncbi:DUF4743 domain-containing protein [Roseomonas sp. BN140053]|uniref:NUDIX hydrolase n=1 Tax=Roseomonas sp. BN140053 TaxID=3391898 RepID=UPI0039EC290D
MDAFARHIAACNNLPSFVGLLPFLVGGQPVGWLRPAIAAAMRDLPGLHATAEAVALDPALDTPDSRSEALAGIAASLAARGLFRLRCEAFDVRPAPEAEALARIDRGAVAPLGILSRGAHCNGLVRRADGLHLWVGWRARNKAVAPGQLDNIVAGGVPAGLSPWDTLLKEAGEEASVPPELAARARPVGQISYVMLNEEGLRRDVLHCFDLELPEDFQPRPNDDEVERFELWPAARVLDAVRDGDTVKFNVNLVLIDLFLRENLLSDPDGSLRAGLSRFR